jgi:2-polyprenyl-3-methyl-5-hydroxy-6-metoxy-1,4-benzoquinol methylase
MFDFEFQDKIRAQEVAATVAHFGQPPARVLEIGAGAGVQAKYLAELDFDVTAIDLVASQYESLRVFPVLDYDGLHMPFADQSFDLIYSSHVVMHIVDTGAFHREVQRVLKPGGRVLHAVPTAAWRFWTFALHYPANVLNRCRRWVDGPVATAAVALAHTRPGSVVGGVASAASCWARMLKLPRRIGEHGNVLTEHWRFSDAGWRRAFRQHGWEAIAGEPNRIFYTGHMALSSRIPLRVRRLLSHILGSAGRLYVLRAQR